MYTILIQYFGIIIYILKYIITYLNNDSCLCVEHVIYRT